MRRLQWAIASIAQLSCFHKINRSIIWAHIPDMCLRLNKGRMTPVPGRIISMWVWNTGLLIWGGLTTICAVWSAEDLQIADTGRQQLLLKLLWRARLKILCATMPGNFGRFSRAVYTAFCSVRRNHPMRYALLSSRVAIPSVKPALGAASVQAREAWGPNRRRQRYGVLAAMIIFRKPIPIH